MLALYNCRVLDPACGSGAFPMGVLQQMVHVLKRIDPTNEMWNTMMVDIAIEDARKELLKVASGTDAEKKKDPESLSPSMLLDKILESELDGKVTTRNVNGKIVKDYETIYKYLSNIYSLNKPSKSIILSEFGVTVAKTLILQILSICSRISQ